MCSNNHIDPIAHARHLASMCGEQTTPPFFAKLHSDDPSFLQRQLCSALVSAVIGDLNTFEQELKEEINRTKSQLLISEGKQSYIDHSNRVLCKIQDLFVGRPDIETRIADALEERTYSKDSFYQIGQFFPALWYGISGTYPSNSTVSSLMYALNCLHDELILSMTGDIKAEYAEEKQKSNMTRLSIYLSLSVILNIVFLLLR